MTLESILNKSILSDCKDINIQNDSIIYQIGKNNNIIDSIDDVEFKSILKDVCEKFKIEQGSFLAGSFKYNNLKVRVSLLKTSKGEQINLRVMILI